VIKVVAWAVVCALTLPVAPLSAQQPAEQAAPKKSAPRAAAPEDTVMLNFVNADLEAVVRAIGQFTGRAFVIDPRVKGTINLVTERPVTKQQAYEQLLSALRLQGFTIVESPRPGGIARILPEADAKLQGGRVIAPQATTPRGDQIVTQVFQLQYESATNMVPVLRPLIAPNNTISAYPANNSLVITDYADNLRRLAQIIAAIDQPGAAEPEIIPLRHGLAVEIATIANRVLDEGARATGQAVDAGQRVQVLAEPRTNSLIVRASSRARSFVVRQFIEKLDLPSVTPGNINVVYLRNAEATKLAPLLRAIISSDPSFVPQASTGSGLSAGVGAPGGVPGQPGAPPQQQQQQIGGGGGAAGAGSIAGMIQPDAATNSLIITAPEPLYRNIRATIEKLDVRRAQVVIESLIVEVSNDKAAEFGVQWQALGGLRESNSNNTAVVGGTNFGGSNTNIISAAQSLANLGPGLNLGVIRGTVQIAGQTITNLGFLARALETQAAANVLSRPNIQTLDNEEAKFLVGQNVPFVTGSFTQGTQGATNPFQTFERKDIGTQLRVRPQISEGGAVKLAIYVEVSSIAQSSVPGQIVTNKRSFESNVIVEDGNLVVLSGLIEDRANESDSRVPLLGSIPLIGWLFRYENRNRTKTNTMVFLRPHVIRDEGTSSAFAIDRYDYMRTQFADAQKPENLVFRGLRADQLPPAPQPRTKAPATPVPEVNGAPLTQPPGAGTPAQPDAPSTPPAPGAAPSSSVAPSSSAIEAPGARPGVASPQVGAPVSGAFAASSGAPQPSTGVQLIQVAQFASIAQGRALQRDLRTSGFDAYWESVRGASGELIRVRVAVDRSRQNVADIVEKLKARGLQPELVNP
jgi:general secretion pathway protein D